MILINVHIFVVTLIGVSVANKVLYVLPDNNSLNISCQPHQCATISEYFLDNNKLPVVSNVEYRFLPGDHYLTTTAIVVLEKFQNLSLFGISNEQLQPPLINLVSTNISIVNSYNVTIKNLAFKALFHSNLQLAVCVSCTVQNVTLVGCGLSADNLLGRSSIQDIVINLLTKPSGTECADTYCQCYSNQGITLRYSLNRSKSEFEIANNEKHINAVQNISVYHDNSSCYAYTDKGILNVEIEQNQTVDNLEIIISDSQFHNLIQTILYIKSDNKNTKCIVWVKNCAFVSNFVYNTSIITAKVPLFEKLF